MKTPPSVPQTESATMSEAEELKLLRYLVEQHCKSCNDCNWERIPVEGLTERTWYGQYPNFERHPENASCAFAQYWNKTKNTSRREDETDEKRV